MSLCQRANEHHAVRVDEKLKTDLVAFDTLLREHFEYTGTAPSSLDTEIDGHRVVFLNPHEIAVHRKCALCPKTQPTDGVANLSQLAIELQRPFYEHNCKARQAGTPVPPAKKTNPGGTGVPACGRPKS